MNKKEEEDFSLNPFSFFPPHSTFFCFLSLFNATDRSRREFEGSHFVEAKTLVVFSHL